MISDVQKMIKILGSFSFEYRLPRYLHEAVCRQSCTIFDHLTLKYFFLEIKIKK